MKLNELLENVEVLNILGDMPSLVLRPMVTNSFQRPLNRVQLLFSANTSPTNGNRVLHTSP